MRRGTTGQLVATGLVAAGLTWGIARASVRSAREIDPRIERRSGASVRLAAPTATYVFHPGSGKIVARTKDGATARDIALELVVDGEARPLALERAADTATERNAFGASFGFSIGEELFDALVSLRVVALDATTGALAVDLTVQPAAEEEGAPTHHFALRFEVPAGGRSPFVSGVGEIGDLGSLPSTGRSVEIDADPHAIGIAPASGALDVAALVDSPADPRAQLRIAATTAPQPASLDQAAQMGLRFVLADSSSSVWRALYELAGEPVAKMTGMVTGLPSVDRPERARVFGLDAEGLPRVRAQVDEGGRFELFVPQSISLWYAAIDPSRTSTPVAFTSGLPWDLRLDVSPGGELLARVLDADTGHALTARLLVHGIDGTLDPSFGPDYRASGAGPIIDSLHGEVATPLPTGRYRVSATKGLEWSIDAKTVEIVSGRSASVDLALRHVVPTPGVVSCDLHVHARPSFDCPVLAEDRVLSLVAAGVDFAVPSEHNLIGDYGPALEALDLTRDLATVNGVEITTFWPRFGHFGLFPYAGPKIPPFKATNINAVFNFAHKSAPSAILQVNHPRLGKGIGYFDVFHFDPKRPPPAGMRTDFDTLEVYNGYETRTAEELEVNLRDWYALLDMGYRYAATGSSDSHRIQYQWAGYPRTMAIVGDDAGGDQGSPIDTQAVVAALKKGHAFVTSGPMIEFSLRGARPGDEITTEDATVQGHLRVRAAPWVDVTSVEIVVGGKSIDTFAIPARPAVFGPELGDKAEAEERTVRYDADVSVPVGQESTWVVVVVRGDRKMDDALPFMPVAPRAFTNPIYVKRSSPLAPPSPLPEPTHSP
ncbi:MAG: CehA/McbA family metallohydrolase [Polyangiaceae bacterium]